MSPQTILAAVKAFAGNAIAGLDAAALLYATAKTESSLGANVTPRFERAYAPGGFLYKGSKLQRDLYAKYGRLAASSVGPFQIMPVVAYELGFRGHPKELNNVFTAAPIVLKYYVARFARKGGKTPQEAYRAYNGGNIRATIPASNLERFMRAWNEFFEVIEPQIAKAATGLGLSVLVAILIFLAVRKPRK